MRFGKVSYSKSDLQGHWYWCHSLGNIGLVLHCNYMSLSCAASEILRYRWRHRGRSLLSPTSLFCQCYDSQICRCI